MSWKLFSLSTASAPLPCQVSHIADAISSGTERPLGADRSGYFCADYLIARNFIAI
jgi:hypothetical protein